MLLHSQPSRKPSVYHIVKSTLSKSFKSSLNSWRITIYKFNLILSKTPFYYKRSYHGKIKKKTKKKAQALHLLNVCALYTAGGVPTARII